MTCDTATQRMKALLDGELSRPQAWRVRRHIARCAGCREEWDALRSLNAALRSADLFPPETAPHPERSRLPRRLVLGVAMTAVLAALLIIRHYRC